MSDRLELKRLADKTADRIAELESKVRDYEELMSECVSPKCEDAETGEVKEFMRDLGDGHRVPVMRGDPKLKEFVTMILEALATSQFKVRDLEAENERLRAKLKSRNAAGAALAAAERPLITGE